jgi:hypothetical protein
LGCGVAGVEVAGDDDVCAVGAGDVDEEVVDGAAVGEGLAIDDDGDEDAGMDMVARMAWPREP